MESLCAHDLTLVLMLRIADLLAAHAFFDSKRVAIRVQSYAKSSLPIVTTQIHVIDVRIDEIQLVL